METNNPIGYSGIGKHAIDYQRENTEEHLWKNIVYGLCMICKKEIYLSDETEFYNGLICVDLRHKSCKRNVCK